MAMGCHDRAQVLRPEAKGFDVLQDGGSALAGSGVNQDQVPQVHEVRAAVFGRSKAGGAHQINPIVHLLDTIHRIIPSGSR
jgi:hypothetical protein